MYNIYNIYNIYVYITKPVISRTIWICVFYIIGKGIRKLLLCGIRHVG